MTTALTTFRELMAFRKQDPLVPREVLAVELRVSSASIYRFESGKSPLPRRCSVNAYIEGIKRIRARWEEFGR